MYPTLQCHLFCGVPPFAIVSRAFKNWRGANTVVSNAFVSCHQVGRQAVNIPSFMVRVDSQKHIDFSLTSPLGGGRPGRVKRKNQKAAAKKASGGDGDEEDEE
ncbi:hypothetical protein D5086_021771 [Populus alba]|uniref:Uncharacterized protein n=1 Tax=Populus alba TaxID=43335 RepID=A0ACC4BD53_POPAL